MGKMKPALKKRTVTKKPLRARARMPARMGVKNSIPVEALPPTLGRYLVPGFLFFAALVIVVGVWLVTAQSDFWMRDSYVSKPELRPDNSTMQPSSGRFPASQ